jgi:hypothetical protein
LENVLQQADDVAFGENVKREINTMSAQGEPTSGKTGANP